MPRTCGCAPLRAAAGDRAETGRAEQHSGVYGCSSTAVGLHRHRRRQKSHLRHSTPPPPLTPWILSSVTSLAGYRTYDLCGRQARGKRVSDVQRDENVMAVVQQQQLWQLDTETHTLNDGLQHVLAKHHCCGEAGRDCQVQRELEHLQGAPNPGCGTLYSPPNCMCHSYWCTKACTPRALGRPCLFRRTCATAGQMCGFGEVK